MLRDTASAAQLTVKAVKPVLSTMWPKSPRVHSVRMVTTSREMCAWNAPKTVLNVRVPQCALSARKGS